MSKHTQLGKVLDREHEKHRNLIAAAPAMYEALKTIQWLAEEGLSSLEQAANDGGKDAHAEYDRAWNALDQLQAALTQAEGRTL